MTELHVLHALTGSDLAGTHAVAQERVRQIAEEGWTPEHDRQHPPGDMLLAGRCYLLLAYYQLAGAGVDSPEIDEMMEEVPDSWPWDDHWWKPSENPVRNLERGTALCCAELDREIGGE